MNSDRKTKKNGRENERGEGRKEGKKGEMN